MKTKDFLKKTHIERNPSPEFQAKMRESLVGYMKNNPPLPHEAPVLHGPLTRFPRKALAISLASFMVLFAGTMGTVFAAQGTLPGDTLYGVKLAVDQLSIAVSNSPSVRMSVADRRLAEVKQALATQSDSSARAQADIQSALAQYQSNLQVIAAEMTASSSVSSAVQNIIQKTTDNERDLEQMLSGKENVTIEQGLTDSLQSSEKTIAAASADLENVGSGGAGRGGETYANAETTSSTPLAISSAAPDAGPETATSSPRRNDAVDNVPSNGGRTGDRGPESSPHSHFLKKTLLFTPDSTSTVASTSVLSPVSGSDDGKGAWNLISAPQVSDSTSTTAAVAWATFATTTATKATSTTTTSAAGATSTNDLPMSTSTATMGGSDDREKPQAATSTASASASTSTTMVATTTVKAAISTTATSTNALTTNTSTAATSGGSDDRGTQQAPASIVPTSTTATSAVSSTSTEAASGRRSGTDTQDSGGDGGDGKRDSD